MAIDVKCPKCRLFFSIGQNYVEPTVNCPECETTFDIKTNQFREGAQADAITEASRILAQRRSSMDVLAEAPPKHWPVEIRNWALQAASRAGDEWPNTITAAREFEAYILGRAEKDHRAHVLTDEKTVLVDVEDVRLIISADGENLGVSIIGYDGKGMTMIVPIEEWRRVVRETMGSA